MARVSCPLSKGIAVLSLFFLGRFAIMSLHKPNVNAIVQLI